MRMINEGIRISDLGDLLRDVRPRPPSISTHIKPESGRKEKLFGSRRPDDEPMAIIVETTPGEIFPRDPSIGTSEQSPLFNAHVDDIRISRVKGDEFDMSEVRRSRKSPFGSAGSRAK
jgi:hypothetical protein